MLSYPSLIEINAYETYNIALNSMKTKAITPGVNVSNTESIFGHSLKRASSLVLYIKYLSCD